MYCPGCGKQITVNDHYCPYCGKQLNSDQQPSYTVTEPQYQGQYSAGNPNYNYRPDYGHVNGDDAPSIGYSIISVFVPIIGIILYFLFKRNYPNRAQACGIAALIGFLINLIIVFSVN